MAQSLEAQFARLDVSGSGESEASVAECQLRNLLNPDTVQYIKEGKTIILMRGVPGCGKTFIVGRLKDSLNTSAVCSADDYFVRSGTYRFDRSKIKEAHEWCHQKAENYCQNGEPVVIIDNTHVKVWETQFYSRLARRTGYMVFVIIPSGQYTTSPRVLAQRNKHGVDESVIQQKLRAFDVIYPYFYAWFFNSITNEQLYLLGQHAMKRIGKSSIKDVPSFALDKTGLHVTAWFLGKGGDQTSKEQAVRDLASHIGCVDDVKLLDIVVTKQTIAVRVALDQKARRYYKNDIAESHQHSRGYSSLPEGFAAHITLGCANGVSAATAKSDVTLAGLCEVNKERQTTINEITYYPEVQLAVVRFPKQPSVKGVFGHCI